MSYNAHTLISAENMSKLPFIEGKFVYFFNHDGIDSCGILYSINYSNYTKALDRLLGTSTAEIKSGDKVYVMPGCKIPAFKIKNHVKSKGAKLVTDINLATYFIGTNAVHEKVHGVLQEKSGSLLFQHNYPNFLSAMTSATAKQEQLFFKTPAYNALINKQTRGNYKTLGTKAIFNKKPDWEYYVGSTIQFITPAGANILYNSILKSIPIVSEEEFVKQLDAAIIIDQDNYDSILSMLESKDQDNQDTGVEIVCNCDVSKSLLYLWKFSQDGAYAIRNANSKNARLFRDESEWSKISNMSAEAFIVHLKEKGLLTKEWCKELLKEAANVYKDALKTNMFKMVLIPSAEYLEYTEVSDVFEFNHKSVKPIIDEPETEF